MVHLLPHEEAMTRHRFDLATPDDASTEWPAHQCTLMDDEPCMLWFGDIPPSMPLPAAAPRDNTILLITPEVAAEPVNEDSSNEPISNNEQVREPQDNIMQYVAQGYPAMTLADFQATWDQHLPRGYIRLVSLHSAVTMGIQVGCKLLDVHTSGRAHGCVNTTSILITRRYVDGVVTWEFNLAEPRTTIEPARAGCDDAASRSMQQLTGMDQEMTSDVLALLRMVQAYLFGCGVLAHSTTKHSEEEAYTAMVQYVHKPLDPEGESYYKMLGITRARIAVLGIYHEDHESIAICRHRMLMEQPGYTTVIDPLLTLLERGFFSSTPPSLKDIVSQLEAILQRADEYQAVHPTAGVYILALHQVMENLWPSVCPPAGDLPVIYPDIVSGTNSAYAQGYGVTTTGRLHTAHGSDTTCVIDIDHEPFCGQLYTGNLRPQEDPESLLRAEMLRKEERRLVHLAELHQEQRAQWMRSSTHTAAAADEPTYEVDCTFSPDTTSHDLQATSATTYPQSPTYNLVRDITFQPAGSSTRSNAAGHAVTTFCFSSTARALAATAVTTPQMILRAATTHPAAHNDYGAAQRVLQYDDGMAMALQGPVHDSYTCHSNAHVSERPHSDTCSPSVSNDGSCSSPDGCMREDSRGSICAAGYELSCGGSESCSSASDAQAEFDEPTVMDASAAGAPLHAANVDAATTTRSTVRARRNRCSKHQPAQQCEAGGHHISGQQQRQGKTKECPMQSIFKSLPTTTLTGFLALACQIGSQLEEMHAAGRIHGDVSADNVKTIRLKTRSFKTRICYCLMPPQPSENQDARLLSDELAPATTYQKCLDVQQYCFMLLEGLMKTFQLAATSEDPEAFFATLYAGMQDALDASTGCKPLPGLLVALLSALPAEERQQHVWRMQQQMSPQCWDRVVVPLLDLIQVGLLLPGTPNAFSMTDIMRELQQVKHAADTTGMADDVACPVMM